MTDEVHFFLLWMCNLVKTCSAILFVNSHSLVLLESYDGLNLLGLQEIKHKEGIVMNFLRKWMGL